MQLTDAEKAMLDGRAGAAAGKAMELLVRYAEALGAERFVEVSNIAGVPGTTTPFLARYYADRPGGRDAIFAHFDLDSDDLVEMPDIRTNACNLQGGYDPEHWAMLGATPQANEWDRAGEAFVRDRGVRILKTCTPYLAGNVPAFGEHCAWMESSAVVYCNSVLGARTNTEGRESTSAAMVTGRIPDWGFHRDPFRRATRSVVVDARPASLMDWGMLGYFVGEAVGEHVPVLSGIDAAPDATGFKHFGAAAASSGGVEMYHIAGHTPEAPTVEAALGGHAPLETIRYGDAERRRVYETLNATGRSTDVDYVMLGCPHASLEQIETACRLLDGRRIHESCRLWVFTSRAVRDAAEARGLVRTIRDAGGFVLTDTCSAIARAVPPGTRVVALDSAKQVHYLPAMTGIEAWFGSTEDCVHAALTGRWSGVLE